MHVHTHTYWYILVHTVICLFFLLENTCSVQVILRRSPAVSSAFPMGSADTADAHGRCGSNVCEVNTWLWMFAPASPAWGGLSAEETALKKGARHEEQVKRAVETRWRRNAAKESSK